MWTIKKLVITHAAVTLVTGVAISILQTLWLGGRIKKMQYKRLER